MRISWFVLLLTGCVGPGAALATPRLTAEVSTTRERRLRASDLSRSASDRWNIRGLVTLTLERRSTPIETALRSPNSNLTTRAEAPCLDENLCRWERLARERAWRRLQARR